jgi:hypothetical protein
MLYNWRWVKVEPDFEKKIERMKEEKVRKNCVAIICSNFDQNPTRHIATKLSTCL